METQDLWATSGSEHDFLPNLDWRRFQLSWKRMKQVIKLLHSVSFCGAILLMPLLAHSAASKPTVWWSPHGESRREDEPQEKHRIELLQPGVSTNRSRS